MEDAIVAAVMAEKDGALAIVCAPIVAPTIQKILTVPVSIVIPRDSILKAIEVAAQKAL
jgi:predicted transcriptional regulator